LVRAWFREPGVIGLAAGYLGNFQDRKQSILAGFSRRIGMGDRVPGRFSDVPPGQRFRPQGVPRHKTGRSSRREAGMPENKSRDAQAI